MKKLKLNFEQFSEAETLSRSHMKTTVSGAPCQCDDDCPGTQTCFKAIEYSKMGVCS